MEKTLTIIAALSREYPRSVMTLECETPLQLVVSAILSAQSTDERVNQIAPHLFKKYRTCEDFASSRPCRAAGIHTISRALQNECSLHHQCV